MSNNPSVFNLHVTGQKGPHTFKPGEVPKILFLAINEVVENDEGIPELNIHIEHFIDMDLIKGQPFENDVRALVGLGPKKVNP